MFGLTCMGQFSFKFKRQKVCDNRKKERRDVLPQRWGKSESPFYLEILIHWSHKKIPLLPLEYVGPGWHHMCSLMMGCYEKISWTRWCGNNGVVTSGSRGQQAQDQVPAGLMSAEDWFLVHTWYLVAVFSHNGRDKGSLLGWFMMLIPFKSFPSLWPNHLSETPSPCSITWGLGKDFNAWI